MSDERICLASGHGFQVTQTSAENLLRHVARYKFALRHLPKPEARVLDIACGTGYGTHLLRVAGHKAIGVDGHGPSVLYANRAYPGCEFYEMNLYHLGWFHPFDAVVSLETLEHLGDPAQAVRCMIEKMKSDGTFICSAPINRSGVTGPSETNPYHLHEFTVEDFKGLCFDYFGECEFWWQNGDDQAPADLFISLDSSLQSGFALAVCKGLK